MTVAFRGRLGFCSNFHLCTVEIAGVEYPSSEHAFVAMKTLDHEERQRIARIPRPGMAKGFGRRMTLRPDWEQVKDAEMLRIVRAKFIQNGDLTALLLATENERLVEVNDWHDNYWGRCDCKVCETKNGRNQLGITLMKVRDELRVADTERRRL